ncbi:MAG: hypothetical protein JWP74_3990 [Marmoricola sp.]|nr:hypothetical protein [Marmoricola sp.]
MPLAVGALLVAGALAGCGSPDPSGRPLPKTAFGPEGMAVEHGTLFAPVPVTTGRPVAGIPCRAPKKPAYHVHTHLAIYVGGHLRPVPAGIGMVGPKAHQTRTGPQLYGPRCYYDLHVHAQDGVIHVEGPARRVYTLGQFFALWGLPLSADRVGPYRGRVTVYVDGRPSLVAPQDIVLVQRRVIQIDLGADVAPQPVDWSHF